MTGPPMRLPAGVDDFLADAETSEGWTSASTALALTGIVLASGVVAFALLVVRRDAPRPLAGVTALAALAGGAGAVLEIGRVADRLGVGWGDAVTDDGSAAALLRLVAAVLLAVGAVQWLADDRRRPGAPATVATGLLAAGALAGWLSFAFDGHTLSRGPELVHRATSVVHASAGSIWAGGVVGLAIVAASGRTAYPSRRAPIVASLVRFSPIASASLAAVAVAGSVMSFWIVDGVTDYVTTTWGRVLMVKLLAVGVAVAFGAYHHWRLVPAMNAAPDDVELVDRARRSLLAEAGAVTAAIVATGLLVGASTL